MLLRQLRECAQKIGIFERRMSSAVGILSSLRKFRKAVAQLSLPFAALVAQEAIVEDHIEPAAQIRVEPPPVPAGESMFETMLHEIVGALVVASQQRASKAAQAGYVGFDQRGLLLDGIS